MWICWMWSTHRLRIRFTHFGSIFQDKTGINAAFLSMLSDGEEIEIETAGQRWMMSWHSPPYAPVGRLHGSAGLCVVGSDLVLVTTDGVTWDFPAGRPEGDESWEETLRREVLEEACAVVTSARLLGFSRGRSLLVFSQSNTRIVVIRESFAEC